MSDGIVSRLMRNHRKIDFLNEDFKPLYEKDDEEDEFEKASGADEEYAALTDEDEEEHDDSQAPVQGKPEDYEDEDPSPEEEPDEDYEDEDMEGPPSSAPHAPAGGGPRGGDMEGPEGEEMPPEEEVPEEEPEEPTEYENPLDNQYAVKFTLGDEVNLTVTGTQNSDLKKGVIDGYDPEGFYKVKWSDDSVTNGLTDIALEELVKKTHESKCVCGCRKFVTETKKVICDRCGRIHEMKKMRESSSFSEQLYTLFSETPNYNRFFNEIARLIRDMSYEELAPGISVYKNDFNVDIPKDYISRLANDLRGNGYVTRLSNTGLGVKISVRTDESKEDPLMLADKSRPKGKLMIRSEAHPVSTATRPNIAEAIRNAFKSRSLREDEEPEVEETVDAFSILKNLDNEFWSQQEEMLEDIEDLGYTVEEINSEYVVVSSSDDDEFVYKIPISGTSRTMTLDFSKAKKL